MAHDPRGKFQGFSVGTCTKGKINTYTSDEDKRKDFFAGLGKIGDIEVLNRFAPKITSGLRTLSKISDSIRTGETNSAIIPNDEGYVLDAVGINPNDAQKAGQFNPGILNRGVAQAESILDKVKGGNYKLKDIPGSFSDLQNLGSLVDGIFTDDQKPKYLALCDASPYAIDLISYAPKYKFLFIVEILLAPEYNFSNHERKLAYVVKTSTRPNINIEHEEINMYNFWTQVPKRVKYEPISMRFYDDNKGLGHLFYAQYLESISPIANLGGYGTDILSVPYLEKNSMGNVANNQKSTASLGVLEGTNTSIIREIRIFHLYDYGQLMTVYHFHHPKLLSMNLDDLEMMDNGAGNEIELQFVYDALHITPSMKVDINAETIIALTGGDASHYPIRPRFKNGQVVETPEGTDGEGNILKTITSGISKGISSVTGLVSDAFDEVADFGGSLFD